MTERSFGVEMDSLSAVKKRKKTNQTKNLTSQTKNQNKTEKTTLSKIQF